LNAAYESDSRFPDGDSPAERQMMERLNYDQEQFFYLFRLDEAVPEDHLVQRIAAVLDLSWVYSELAPLLLQD
jgi:hypothetical protein